MRQQIFVLLALGSGLALGACASNSPPSGSSSSAALATVRLMTEDEAIAKARRPESLSPNVETLVPIDANTPVWAKQGAFSDFSKMTGDFANPGIPVDAPVWLVTVRTPVVGRPGVQPSGTTFKPQPQSDYSVLLNASDGKVISFCGGCAFLDPNAPPTSR